MTAHPIHRSIHPIHPFTHSIPSIHLSVHPSIIHPSSGQPTDRPINQSPPTNPQNNNTPQDVVELDLPGVKRLFLNLEKKVQANLLKRVKFADEPARFLDAELELYEEIGNFKVRVVGAWVC